MKKKIFGRAARSLLLSALILTLCFTVISCNDEEDTEQNTQPETVYFTLSFNSNGGSKIPAMKVEAGTLVNRPDDPTLDGYIFNGWEDLSNGLEWDFTSYTVDRDTTLKARWISASEVYSYTTTPDGNVCITGVKVKKLDMAIPSVIGGMTVTSIADEAFKETKAEEIRSITLPETVTEMGDSAFEASVGVAINVKGKLTSVGEKAFFGCDKLTAVEFGEGMESVSYKAFSGCIALESVTLPSSLTLLDENCFEECEGLVSIILGDKVTKIGDGAFRFCDGLKVIFYMGGEESFDNIVIEGENDPLSDVKVYLYSAEEPDGEGNFWYYNEKGEPKTYN